jgi:hypothetical protein
MSGIGTVSGGSGGVSGFEPLDGTADTGGAVAVGGDSGGAGAGAATTAGARSGSGFTGSVTRSLADVWAALASAATGGGGAAAGTHTNLDASGARLPVALGTNGRFTGTPGTNAETPVAIGDGLYAAATLIDDTKGNLFDTASIGAAERAAVFANLKTDLDGVRAGKAAPQGLTDLQALQMRSSGTTVLLELMTAKDTPADLKREAFGLYRQLIGEETNPLLKDAMVLHLDRLRGSLPADLHGRIDEVMDVVRPDRPPYESWFANGNDTVKVDWSSGSESYQDDIHNLKKDGFEVVSQDSGQTVLRKTYEVNGEETKFEVTLRQFGSDMFDHVDSPDTNMVIYTGHSNWGRNVRDSLGGVDGQGSGKDKLVLTDLCVGKGEMQMFKDTFPEADLVTTFTSSYFISSEHGGEPDSEGIHAILNTFEGIAARKGYAGIAEDVRRENPWGSTHRREGIDNNFIFPTDVANRRKVLDQDHDGQADVFDRLVDFNAFAVKEDTAREFTGIDPARRADELVGTKVHFAAMTVNRLTIYSGVYSQVNADSRVVPGGYHDPKPGEQGIFRFEKTQLDGKEHVVMTMSSRHAHMSEEALRMAASYEYARYMDANRGGGARRLDTAESILSGLVLASHSLDTDAGYRDREVWSAFLKAYNLPQVPRDVVERLKEVDHHWYSGSYQTIDELKKELGPEILRALSARGSGVLGPNA